MLSPGIRISDLHLQRDAVPRLPLPEAVGRRGFCHKIPPEKFFVLNFAERQLTSSLPLW